MRILYVGNYTALGSDGRSYNTEEHICRDLETLGHEVIRLQEPVGGGDEAFVQKIGVVAIAERVDTVGWQRTWGLPSEATKLWRALEDRGIPSFSYHLDLYYGLERQSGLTDDPFWTTTHVFTPDGNPESAEFFAGLGINHHWMPPAVVSDECYLGEPREEFRHDVVFVGSEHGYHEEWPHRREMVAWLRDNYGSRFRRYSGDTGYDLDGKHVDGPVRGPALNDLYASAKVVVGDSALAHRGQWYWSDRPMETWGRGGYLIFPTIDQLTWMVGDYPSWDCGDWNALGDRLDLALSDAYHRDMTSGRLHQMVKGAHTYKHRLAEALQIMGLS